MEAKATSMMAVPVEEMQVQLDIANNRILRAHRLDMDNEYAEGVRDAIAWLLNQGRAPFYDDVPKAQEAA